MLHLISHRRKQSTSNNKHVQPILHSVPQTCSVDKFADQILIFVDDERFSKIFREIKIRLKCIQLQKSSLDIVMSYTKKIKNQFSFDWRCYQILFSLAFDDQSSVKRWGGKGGLIQHPTRILGIFLLCLCVLKNYILIVEATIVWNKSFLALSLSKRICHGHRRKSYGVFFFMLLVIFFVACLMTKKWLDSLSFEVCFLGCDRFWFSVVGELSLRTINVFMY